MNPLKDTPAEVTDKLLRWGGKTEHGDPNWRILLAQNHLVQRAGMWTEFADETEQTHYETVGKDVRFQHREIAPEAIRVGVFWVPLYQITGWILERWFPSSSFGSRLEWESALSQDGQTPMMGPYPDKGDYFMPSGGGPWTEIPNLESVRAAIAQWENSAHLHGHFDGTRVDQAVRMAMHDEEEREERKYDEFIKEVEYQRLSHLAFIKGNPALSGFRNRIASQAGAVSHI